LSPSRRIGSARGGVVLALASVLLGPIAAATPARARGGDPVDIVILTHEPATHDAVRGRLDSSEPEDTHGAPSPSGLWVRGHVEPSRGRPGRYSVALGLAEESDGGSAEAVTQAALEAWRPRYFLLLGTAPAASDKDVRGTLVVPRLICRVEGRAATGEHRGNCQRTDRSLLNAALALGIDRGSDARRDAAAPAALDDGVAIASEAAGDLAFVRALVPLLLQTGRTVVIEREALGTARAIRTWRATRSEPVSFSIIRGVSVLYSGEPAAPASGPEELERTRRQATEAASRFAIDLIRRRWPVPPR
jgi:hypothetical protein